MLPLWGTFSPGHQCPEKSLRVVLLAEDEEGDEGETGAETEQPCMELSAFSAGGLTQQKTLKLQGRMGERKVLILVDSGTSHNFVSHELVRELKLEQEDTSPYHVSLGDGQRKKTRGCCPRVVVCMGDVEITEKFYLFELGGVDMILGVEWLAKLGEITVDWGKSTMSFWQGEKKRTITRDPRLERRVIEPEHLLKLEEMEACALVWSMEGKEGNSGKEEEGKLNKEKEEDIEGILKQYPGVFREIQKLPPNRNEKHQILLKEGTDPINVRPYHYPHAMKEEIECQVAEMLHAGIIRPSISPYSSPVILVKKKDRSWRFCIDYC